jgi:RHS repeat-associated protein
VNEYNIDWSSGQVPDFKFNGKELDEESGMYYFEARYQSPPVFISRDPLFEKYPMFSPYSYCANNPLRYIDPTGETIVITGEEAETAVSHMQSRTKNLTFTRGEDGRISVTGKAKTSEERFMKKNIENKKIEVNVRATNTNKTNAGDDFGNITGAFMGTEIEKNAKGKVTCVDAFQDYQVSNGARDDKKVNSPGNFIWHEIAEGFHAGKISIRIKSNEGKALDDGLSHPIYSKAHNRAGQYFPGQIHTNVYIDHVPSMSISKNKWGIPMINVSTKKNQARRAYIMVKTLTKREEMIKCCLFITMIFTLGCCKQRFVWIPPKGTINSYTIYGCPWADPICCTPMNTKDTAMVRQKAKTGIFKILKIQKTKFVYRFELEKDTLMYNASLRKYYHPFYEVFSIQTDKQKKHQKIRIGKKYQLTLNPYFVHNCFVDGSVRGVYINGINIGVSTLYGNIYTSPNINGLYYIPYSEMKL